MVAPRFRSPQQHIMPSTPRDSFMCVQHAETMRQRKQFGQAARICEALLQSDPDDVAALQTLGLVLADQEKWGDALVYLARAVMLTPGDWAVLTALAGVCLRLGATEQAARTIAQAVAIEPHKAGVLLMLGDIHVAQCEYELARDVFRRALTIDRGLVEAETAIGWCCVEIGDVAEAARVFANLARRFPRRIEPLRALAAIPGPDAEAAIDLLARLNNVAPEPGESEADFGISIAFIRAAALDRMGRHAEAWKWASDANRRMRRLTGDGLAELAERQRCSLTALRQHPGVDVCDGESAEHPISLFILGPSRSGKSTMEALIGCLPGVKRGYENLIVETAARRTLQSFHLPTDNRLSRVPGVAHRYCRDIYVAELERRAGRARILTNTNPGCIFEAASIATVFGRSRFILMKRDIDDNLLRIYMRKYAAANVYAYDLRALRDHLLWYHDMIDLLSDKFPGVTCVVHYEDMVAEPLQTLRKAARFCGLSADGIDAAAIAGDRGCATPYLEFMSAELTGRVDEPGLACPAL
jgi:Flp pilus assembly protein TadD